MGRALFKYRRESTFLGSINSMGFGCVQPKLEGLREILTINARLINQPYHMNRRHLGRFPFLNELSHSVLGGIGTSARVLPGRAPNAGLSWHGCGACILLNPGKNL